MARPAGVEPTTPSLEGWCSIQFELRARLRRAAARPAAPARKRAAKSGRGGEIRTPDILLPKQARYQAAPHPAGVASYAFVPGTVNAERLAISRENSLARPVDFWYQLAFDFATRRSRLGAAAQILPALPAEKRRGVHESQAARAFQEGSRGAEGGAVAGYRPDGPRDAGRRDRVRRSQRPRQPGIRYRPGIAQPRPRAQAHQEDRGNHRAHRLQDPRRTAGKTSRKITRKDPDKKGRRWRPFSFGDRPVRTGLQRQLP